jgi:hypothetical protein
VRNGKANPWNARIHTFQRRLHACFYVLLLDEKGVFSEEEILDLENEYPEITVFYASRGTS